MVQTKLKGISENERKIIIVKQVPNANHHEAYEGKPTTVPNDYVRELFSRPRSSKYMAITYDQKHYESMKEQYDYFVKCADELKKYSDGKINMYKTGNFSKTSLAFFYSIFCTMTEYDILTAKDRKKKSDAELKVLQSKNVSDRVDDICPHEVRFIKDSGGGFRMSRKYKGKLFEYDFRSFYPFIMRKAELKIPIKAGILETLTQSDLDSMPFFRFGVYHCSVSAPDEEQLKKLVRLNRSNYYTSDELSYFKSKGLEIKMIDEPENFLHYPRDYYLTGSQVFGKYVDYLFEAKQQDVSGSKEILNHLWGSLVKFLTRYCRSDSVEYKKVSDEGWEKKKFWPVDPDDDDCEIFMCKMINWDSPFEYNLARIRPFLLAKCRITMAKEIEPHVKYIHHSHTDSFLSSIPLPFNDEGKLGDIKFEGMTMNGVVDKSKTTKKSELTKEIPEEEKKYFDLFQWEHESKHRSDKIYRKARRMMLKCDKIFEKRRMMLKK